MVITAILQGIYIPSGMPLHKEDAQFTVLRDLKKHAIYIYIDFVDFDLLLLKFFLDLGDHGKQYDAHNGTQI